MNENFKLVQTVIQSIQEGHSVIPLDLSCNLGHLIVKNVSKSEKWHSSEKIRRNLRRSDLQQSGIILLRQKGGN